MNKQFDMVSEFHKAAGVQMPDTPEMLDRGNTLEDREYLESMAVYVSNISESLKLGAYGGEVATRAGYILEEVAELLRAETIEDQADALGDIAYFTIGTNTLMGVLPEEIFKEIHDANMRKKFPDGTFHRDERGKIIKPIDWYGPEEQIKVVIDIQKSFPGYEPGMSINKEEI